MEKLDRRLGTLRVGDPLDKNTDVGAINSPGQLQIINDVWAEIANCSSQVLSTRTPRVGGGRGTAGVSGSLDIRGGFEEMLRKVLCKILPPESTLDGAR